MKEILLSKKGKHKGKYIALVDDEDFERINKFNWHILKGNNKIYAAMNVCENKISKTIMMHSYIIDSKMADHIDQNGLNNQKFNLRPCTNQQNMMNRKSFKNSASKYKGVTINKKTNKYHSQIYLNRKQFHLGVFIDEIEAAKAYDKKAKELFGEFAYLNFK